VTFAERIPTVRQVLVSRSGTEPATEAFGTDVSDTQTLEVGSRLEGEVVTVRRGNKGTVPLVLSLSDRWTLLVIFKTQTFYPRERTPVQI
jgi:hypothetical protein